MQMNRSVLLFYFEPFCFYLSWLKISHVVTPRKGEKLGTGWRLWWFTNLFIIFEHFYLLWHFLVAMHTKSPKLDKMLKGELSSVLNIILKLRKWEKRMLRSHLSTFHTWIKNKNKNKTDKRILLKKRLLIATNQ